MSDEFVSNFLVFTSCKNREGKEPMHLTRFQISKLLAVEIDSVWK